MKSSVGRISCLLGFCLFPVALAAAERSAVTPLRPGMSWEVRLLPEEERTPSPKLRSRPVEKENVRSAGGGRLLQRNTMGKNFRWQELYESGDESKTRFVTKQFIFEESPETGQLVMWESVRDPDDPRSAESPDQLQEFDWIQPEDHHGVAVVDGVECDIYVAPLLDIHRESPLFETLQVPFRLAAIGKADRFPRRLEGPDGVRQYLPQPLVPVPTMPNAAARLLKEYREQVELQANRFKMPQ